MLSYVALHFCKASRKSLRLIFKLLKGHKYMTRITINNVQWAVTPKAGNAELPFLCFAHLIMVIYICIKFQNISNSFQAKEWTQIYYRNHYFQSSKSHKSKSRLTRVRVLMLCTSSHDALHLCEVSSKYLEQFQLKEQTRVHRNSTTPKVDQPELRFLCSACCLIVLYICEKFHNNISNGFQLTE